MQGITTGTGPTRRLAYLVSQYPAFSHTFILNEVVRLRALGFDIAVASINDPDREPGRFTAEELEEYKGTFYIKKSGAGGALRALLWSLATRPGKTLRGLWFALRQGDSDLVKMLYSLFYFVEAVMVGRWMLGRGISHLHVHFATPASMVGLICRQIYPIGYSFMVHGPDEFYDVPGYRLAQKVAGADFVLTIGSYSRSQMMKVTPLAQWSKFEACPLGVDPDRFTPNPFREHPDPLEIICVGRLVPAKGQHILLKAIGRLRDGGVNVRLRVVGDGPDRASLERLCDELRLEDRVVFEGAVNQDRVRELYRSADVFALASFAEGIPIVLMEAMAMEIPCVTTFITGIPELIRHDIDGLLVAPSDDAALAGAIAALAADPALRRRLGAAGRERVVERYNLARNTEHLARVFDHRIGRASGSGTSRR